MRLSTKLYVGFGVLLSLLVLLSVIVSVKLRAIKSESGTYVTNANFDKFATEKIVDHYKWVRNLEALFLNNQKKAEVQLDHTKCGLGSFLYGAEAKKLGKDDKQAGRIIKEMLQPHLELHASAKEINQNWQQRHEGLTAVLQSRLEDHLHWAAKVTSSILRSKIDEGIQVDGTKCALGRFLASPEYEAYAKGYPKFAETMGALTPVHSQLHESAKKVNAALAKQDTAKATEVYGKEIGPALASIQAGFASLISAEKAIEARQSNCMSILQTKTVPALATTQEGLEKLSKHLSSQASVAEASLQGDVDTSQQTLAVVSILACILGIGISIFLARSITAPVLRAVAGLCASSSQVSSASNQVSETSQHMAEGANEQASSLEEISSSLEEITSMTEKNAENARSADGQARAVGEAAEQGRQAVAQMLQAVAEIKESSDKTAAIVKNIDEIAFQTNLLALNAAVEAARAGEAGRGFAVVAEEVRNLAQRSATAAKDTSELIDESIRNSENGVVVTQGVTEALQRIVDGIGEVSQLVSEVRSANDEQSRGIGQINTGVNQLSTVTQGNAANAEETASASEELSGQASELQSLAASLEQIVSGSSTQASSS